MNSPRDLLTRLLEYIEEQAKIIDPKSYCISAAKGFIRRNTELSGLPGLEFDIRPEGDHIWLRLERLEAHPPPVTPDQYKELFKISNDPFGSVPTLDESNLAAWITQCESKLDSGITMIQNANLKQGQLKQKAQTALQEYMMHWNAWAEGERPRRKSISLYGDLFALKHQIEAEETIKPQELVWGIGIASWQIPFGEITLDFEYPILTQVVEISIDEKSMALEVRQRATNTRVEMEAFIACSILEQPI